MKSYYHRLQMVLYRFRWAFCQLDTLRRCMPSSIRKALNELPTTLDETYERVLQEIPKEKREHAHRLFQCLVVAIRPLRVEELAELFAIEFDRDAGPSLKKGWRPESPEDAVLSACSTLIAVIENRGSKIVQFSHFSVKEYLTSDRLRTSKMYDYHIPLVTAHTILARACLIVLLQLDENVDTKPFKTFMARYAEEHWVDHFKYENVALRFPLVLYAAKHWVDHAKYEDVASRIQGAMEELFNPSKPYLAAWTGIHHVDSYEARGSIGVINDFDGDRPKATALYYAALCGFSGLANYLIITHGENVHAKCGNHGSPLYAASYKGNLDVIRLLLAHGVDINAAFDKDGITALSSAYEGRHLDAMRLLLEHGADADALYNSFHPACLLHNVSSGEDLDFKRLLLQHNANVNARDSMEWTPLHNASWWGMTRVAQLLLECGADINARSWSPFLCTPLYLASERGHLEVVQLLLGHGADVHLRGSLDLTPFQVATSKGHIEVAQLLLDYGAEKE